MSSDICSISLFHGFPHHQISPPGSSFESGLSNTCGRYHACVETPAVYSVSPVPLTEPFPRSFQSCSFMSLSSLRTNSILLHAPHWYLTPECLHYSNALDHWFLEVCAGNYRARNDIEDCLSRSKVGVCECPDGRVRDLVRCGSTY
jgi:hypothetical protein